MLQIHGSKIWGVVGLFLGGMPGFLSHALPVPQEPPVSGAATAQVGSFSGVARTGNGLEASPRAFRCPSIVQASTIALEKSSAAPNDGIFGSSHVSGRAATLCPPLFFVCSAAPLRRPPPVTRRHGIRHLTMAPLQIRFFVRLFFSFSLNPIPAWTRCYRLQRFAYLISYFMLTVPSPVAHDICLPE